jgi:DNA-directed RNA polymerase subunit RPC12/RpoP
MPKFKIDDKNFKDGDVVQLCTHCGWQTESPGSNAIAKCPECRSSLIPIGVSKKKASKKAEK